MVTRYVTYLIQFIVSVLIAAKLGPYQLGIWGFVLLLINYFNIFNFGIPNSATVLMVQHKNEQVKANKLEVSSILLIGVISLIIILIGCYYALFGIALFDKYQIGGLFYLVCAIAIMQHFVSLFSLIARVRGSITEVAFAQTVIPILTLVTVLLLRDRILLVFLILSYIVGNLLAIILFIKKRLVRFHGIPSVMVCREIIRKGKYLFVYNVCFYLIFLSTKTIVSNCYSVEEFGFFTFAYTLSNAVLLMMQAFTAIVFPKLIDKFGSDNYEMVSNCLHEVRESYVTMAHAIMYIAFLLFPILLFFMPKYQEALPIIMYMGLTLLLYANSFGYSTLLIAQNIEKGLAVISVVSLTLNIFLALLLSVILHCNYKYVIFSTMAAYLLFTVLCVVTGKFILKEKISFLSVVNDSFPVRLFVPYLFVVLAVATNGGVLPLLVSYAIFVSINKRSIYYILSTMKRIVINPNVVDIK